MTLSSGIIAALPQLVKNPTSIPSLLATQLPQASNFFLTYTILQGLTGTASGFLQIVPLAIYYVKLFLMGSTPRSVYTIKYTLRNIQWGTLFPATTLIAVISTYYHESYLKSVMTNIFCLSYCLFDHLADHQWTRVRDVLLVLPVVEIPFPLPIRTTHCW